LNIFFFTNVIDGADFGAAGPPEGERGP